MSESDDAGRGSEETQGHESPAAEVEVSQTEQPVDDLPASVQKYPASDVQIPQVIQRRIKRITTYEVLETEIRALEDATHAESHRLAFGCFCGGSLVSVVTSWLGSASTSPMAFGGYVAATLALLVATAFFFSQWYDERSKRKSIIERIRSI